MARSIVPELTISKTARCGGGAHYEVDRASRQISAPKPEVVFTTAPTDERTQGSKNAMTQSALVPPGPLTRLWQRLRSVDARRRPPPLGQCAA
jgi:hypothetical protein